MAHVHTTFGETYAFEGDGADRLCLFAAKVHTLTEPGAFLGNKIHIAMCVYKGAGPAEESCRNGDHLTRKTAMPSVAYQLTKCRQREVTTRVDCKRWYAANGTRPMRAAVFPGLGIAKLRP